jgi:phage shock protein E
LNPGLDTAVPAAGKEQLSVSSINIPVAEVERGLAREDLILVDVRSPQQFAEGHIPTAINIPIEQIETLAPELLNDRDAWIATYDDEGSEEAPYSEMASLGLMTMGYTHTGMLTGGLAAWTEAGNQTSAAVAERVNA